MTRHLTNLLAEDVNFEYTIECLQSFNQLKKELTSALIMNPLNWNLPYELLCDASDYAICTVLGQKVDKYPRVIHYENRTLNDAQLNYSVTKK